NLQGNLHRVSTGDPLSPRQLPASAEYALFSTTYISSRWRDSVVTCGALWNPEALASYNFIYSGIMILLGPVHVKLEIDIDLPPRILDQIPADELGKLCGTEIVLRLYSEDKLAPAEAAKLLGLSRLQFLDLLRERGVGFR